MKSCDHLNLGPIAKNAFTLGLNYVLGRTHLNVGGLKNLFYCKIADLCVHVYNNANRLKILMIYKTGYTVAYSKSVLQMFRRLRSKCKLNFFLTSHELDFQLR